MTNNSEIKSTLTFRTWIARESRRSGYPPQTLLKRLVAQTTPKVLRYRTLCNLYYSGHRFVNKSVAQKYSDAIQTYVSTRKHYTPERTVVRVESLMLTEVQKSLHTARANKRRTTLRALSVMAGPSAKTEVIRKRVRLQPHPTKKFVISLDTGKTFVPYFVFEQHGLLDGLFRLVEKLESHTAEDLLKIDIPQSPDPKNATRGQYLYRNKALYNLNTRTSRLNKKLKERVLGV